MRQIVVVVIQDTILALTKWKQLVNVKHGKEFKVIILLDTIISLARTDLGHIAVQQIKYVPVEMPVNILIVLQYHQANAVQKEVLHL